MKILEFQTEFSDALRRQKTPVVVTGAGGWLGRAALEMLDHTLGDDFPRVVHAFGARAREMALRSGRLVAIRPLTAITQLALPDALVLHFAFLTREHASRMELAEYMRENRKISTLVQDFLRRNGAMGVFNPSSGAVYAGTDAGQNPYGALKHADEVVFGELGQSLGFPAVRMRVFNLAGPFINKLDSYALACIIGDITRGRQVVLRAAHPVWRGYAHVADVLNIALGFMLKNVVTEVFDSAGERVEIGALALRAGALLGRRVEIVRPEWRDGVADDYLGDGAAFALHATRAGVALRGLDEQILDTADYLRFIDTIS